MKANLKLLGFVLLFSQSLLAQEVAQYNYGLVKFKLPPDHTNRLIEQVPQNILIHKEQLYLIPDGTGRVYRLDYRKGNTIERVDSTIYFGFTFGSYTFFYQDTLYSFGGYGYWQTNGQLRVYVPQKHEWELEPLNREVAFYKGGNLSVNWLDETNGKLWLGYSINQREGLKKQENFDSIKDSVYVLNLSTKEFQVAGVLNQEIGEKVKTNSTRHLAASPWGQLIYDSEQNTILLLDFRNNSQLTLNDSKTKQILRIIPMSGWLHFNDSTLVVQSGSSWLSGDFVAGDSILMTKSDFVDSGHIYESPLSRVITDKKYSAYWYLIAGLLVGCIITSLVLYYLVIRKLTQLSKRKMLIDFDEKEKEVIRFISINSSKGVGTTVEQMNQLLGVANKNLEIQKKQRSDLFLSINEKWGRANNGVLIDKRRLEHDKRSYEYFIDKQNVEAANSLCLVLETKR